MFFSQNRLLRPKEAIGEDCAVSMSEIYGLQRIPGSTEWLNGRNRLDTQLQNEDSESSESSEVLFFRQKYFPDVSLLSAKETAVLIRN